MRYARLAAWALFASSCGPAHDGSNNRASNAAGDQWSSPSKSQPERAVPMGAAERWNFRATSEAFTLALVRGGGPTISLICQPGMNQLVVNVASFRPIGSEERLSFGGKGDALALVADTRDAARGGVSGVGAIPSRLAAMLRGEVSASYGAQRSGPHPAPPQRLAQAFATECGRGAAIPVQTKRPSAERPSACLMQGSALLSVTPRRAVGTEPFWGARVEGRCVTYSHPDDQDGTRVWTQYSAAPGSEIWSGTLEQKPFELRIRNEPGCSDGMSDKRYPLGAHLTVNGERRKGCAEPTSN